MCDVFCGHFREVLEYDGLFDGTDLLQMRWGFKVGFVDFEIVAGFPLSRDVDIEKKYDDEYY
jgi:hypothetical protein